MPGRLRYVAVTGKAADVGIGANGHVWIIGTNIVDGGQGVWKYNAATSRFEPFAGGGVRIAVDPNGRPWVVNDAGNIYWHDATGTGWAQIPGTAKDVGVGANGDVWIIGTNQVNGGWGVWKFNAATGQFEPFDGGGLQIDVNPNGHPWVVNVDGNIFRHEPPPPSGPLPPRPPQPPEPPPTTVVSWWYWRYRFSTAEGAWHGPFDSWQQAQTDLRNWMQTNDAKSASGPEAVESPVGQPRPEPNFTLSCS